MAYCGVVRSLELALLGSMVIVGVLSCQMKAVDVKWYMEEEYQKTPSVDLLVLHGLRHFWKRVHHDAGI